MIAGLPSEDLFAVLPLLLPALGGLLTLVLVAVAPHKNLRGSAALTLGVLGLSAAATAAPLGLGVRREVLGGALIVDHQGLAFHLVFLVVAALTVLVSIAHLEASGDTHGEYFALIQFAVTGMSIMASSHNLLSIFVGLEILSIPLYVLAGFTRDKVYAVEGALKYFLLGAFSTGFILYGMALLYGSTGHIDLPGIGLAMAGSPGGEANPVALAGGALLLVGLGFKIAAVPFHFWAPDVYQGSMAPVSGFMATGTKAAAFAALLRIVTTAFGHGPMRASWTEVVSWIAVLTMVAGNVIALAQQNIKRMLAYSSIANAGYLLVALVATGRDAEAGGSLLFYLMVYAFMTIGAFAVASVLGRSGEGDEGYALSAYAGLGRRRPLLAAAMLLFMLSLTGIPPAAGFMAKFYVFRAAVRADLVPLAVVGLLASVIGAFYYLRVVVQMYFREPAPQDAATAAHVSPTDAVALAAAAFALLAIGLFPSGLLALSRFAG